MVGLEFSDLVGALPCGILAVGACLLLILQILDIRSGRSLVYVASLVGAFASLFLFEPYNLDVLHKTMSVNLLTAVFCGAILMGGLFCYLISSGSLSKEKVLPVIEIDVLFLCAIIGGLVLASATNMLLVFLGFELLSICVYALCGAAKDERSSSEAALKYFLLGAFSSGFLLYGMALVYAGTGSFYFPDIAASMNPDSMVLKIGIAMIMFGFAFKVSLVPFHIWTPDVYQGAPTSITAFMAVIVKLAAFFGFMKMFATAFSSVASVWIPLVCVLAGVSMTVGNVMALQQKSVKRMLAYSSIAHAGYVMLGFLGFGSGSGMQAATYYLIAYAFMTISSFGCVALVTSGTDNQYDKDTIDSFKGLGWRSPVLGLVMTIAMFALAGMPPLLGFLGKFYLFSSAVQSGFTGLVVLAAINSVISLYYYLRVIVAMYFGESEEQGDTLSLEIAPQCAVYGATAVVVVLGLFSSSFLRLIASSIH